MIKTRLGQQIILVRTVKGWVIGTELCRNIQTYSDCEVPAATMKKSPIPYHQLWSRDQYVKQLFQEDDENCCEACNK
jgi:hypothetical protein